MLLFISLFTIIIALLLVYNNYKINKNTILLSWYFIIIAIYGITHHFVVNGVSVFWIAIFFNNFSPLMLLLGPFLFIYVKNNIKSKTKIKTKEYIHFIPAAIQFIGVIPYYLTSFEYKEKIASEIISNINVIKDLKINLFFPTSVSFIIRPILLIIYIMACFILIKKYYDAKSKKNLLDNNNMKWILILLTSSLVISLNYIIISIDGFIKNQNFVFIKNDTIFYISGIALFIIAFSLLLFPDILYGLPTNTTQNAPQKSLKTDGIKKSNENKPKTDVKEFNNSEQFQDSIEIIKKFIEIEKAYLDTEFSLQSISIKLNIPKQVVSSCIKLIWNKKFNELKNELRIEHAKKLLENGSKENYTIDGIAQTSGFKTRSNFYYAFKAETGVTPTEYIDTKESI